MPPGVGRWRFQIERNTLSPALMLRAEEELLERVRDGEPPACRIWQAARGIVVAPLFDRPPRFCRGRSRMEAGAGPVLPRPFRRARRSRQMPGVLNLSFVYPVA